MKLFSYFQKLILLTLALLIASSSALPQRRHFTSSFISRRSPIRVIPKFKLFRNGPPVIIFSRKNNGFADLSDESGESLDNQIRRVSIHSPGFRNSFNRFKPFSPETQESVKNSQNNFNFMKNQGNVHEHQIDSNTDLLSQPSQDSFNVQAFNGVQNNFNSINKEIGNTINNVDIQSDIPSALPPQSNPEINSQDTFDIVKSRGTFVSELPGFKTSARTHEAPISDLQNRAGNDFINQNFNSPPQVSGLITLGKNSERVFGTLKRPVGQ